MVTWFKITSKGRVICFLCSMINSLDQFHHPYFIGIAGTGMSALAQYLQGIGKQVEGSDRFFVPDVYNETKTKLEKEGIRCHPQNGEAIHSGIDLIVVSTAIEDTVIEVQKAKELGIPIMHRASLLALIAASKKTIAVAGTSGKSTTSAMLFDMLEQGGLAPSIISGAGLTRIIRQEKIGNAFVGKGDWLVIEADESDGSIVQYHPAIGLLLNIDKDHEEVDSLVKLFSTFKANSEKFVVNQGHSLAATLSVNRSHDFIAGEDLSVGYRAIEFQQEGLSISFKINGVPFGMTQIGRHNMENALAAAAVANQLGVPLDVCATALKDYQGIYRRQQVLGKKEGVWLIDDYAHNPVKCAAAIAACQPVATKVIAWFQPHGYKPTRFLREDFVNEIAAVLRSQDEIWMSEIYYAGGSAVKDISAADLINDLHQRGANAFFVEDRNQFLATVRPHFTESSVLLLMGARDPSLEIFAQQIWKQL
jgi:UDP-N-acetylmuramate--alanine ligase